MTDRLEQLRSAWPGGVVFTSIHVDRAIAATFASDKQGRASKLAYGYDPGGTERGRSRVLLAAVRLSRGNLEGLESLLRDAEVDFRDVLVSAEYEVPTSPLVARLSDEYLSWFDGLRFPTRLSSRALRASRKGSRPRDGPASEEAPRILCG